MTALLASTTVLDLSTVGPGSRAAAMLADLGANVVKVSAPERMDRITPPVYAYHGGRGTESITIDLQVMEGRQAFLALARTADVILESFRPGVADRLGIGYDDVCEVNPSIVYAALTGYGQDGPLAGWAGHDLNYQALGGVLACQERRPDGGPALPGVTLGDSAGGGMHAALAVCAALVHGTSSGEGTFLDVSAVDGCLELASLLVDQHLMTGVTPTPRSDMITGGYACYDLYEARDGGWLAVAAIEPKFFATLCQRLGCDRWIDHQLEPDLQDEIRADLQSAFLRRDRDDWVAELGPADCCVSPVLEIDEIADHPQLSVRVGTVELELPDGTIVRQLAPALAGSEPVDHYEAGSHGKSDAEELLGAAGVDSATIAKWRQSEAVA